MALKLITAPAVEPVTLDEARDHIRVHAGVDTHIIEALISAARRHAETFTGRALITQTWDLYLDRWPKIIYVPKPPIESVTSVKYLDTAGVLQTLVNTLYRTDLISQPARITEAYGTVWPTAQPVTIAISVRFVAGYGLASTDIPEGIIQAILMLVGHWYDNRTPIGQLVKEIPFSVNALLWPYRDMEF